MVGGWNMAVVIGCMGSFFIFVIGGKRRALQSAKGKIIISKFTSFYISHFSIYILHFFSFHCLTAYSSLYYPVSILLLPASRICLFKLSQLSKLSKLSKLSSRIQYPGSSIGSAFTRIQDQGSVFAYIQYPASRIDFALTNLQSLLFAG